MRYFSIKKLPLHSIFPCVCHKQNFNNSRLLRIENFGQFIFSAALTQIVAYTSLVPIPIKLQNPGCRVFEASSGWTRPGWRRMGLQVQMRRHLYRDKTNDLLISFGVGLGAAFVLRRLGWTLYSWPDRLGVSDFIGDVADGKLLHRLGDAIELDGREPFRLSNPVDLDRHDWDRYLHLWVSNAELATSLRQRILLEVSQGGPA
jgi:hypothetical protein